LDGNNVPFGQSELVELYNNVAECEEESFDNNWPVDLDCDEQPHLGHDDYVLEDAATDSVLDNYNSYCKSIGQRFADCLPNNAAERSRQTFGGIAKVQCPPGPLRAVNEMAFCVYATC